MYAIGRLFHVMSCHINIRSDIIIFWQEKHDRAPIDFAHCFKITVAMTWPEPEILLFAIFA